MRITNAGQVDLHTWIVATLPTQVTTTTVPSGARSVDGGQLQWSTVITAPGGSWSESVIVTVASGYTGTLTNTVAITSTEGLSGVYTQTVSTDRPWWLNLLPYISRAE